MNTNITFPQASGGEQQDSPAVEWDSHRLCGRTCQSASCHHKGDGDCSDTKSREGRTTPMAALLGYPPFSRVRNQCDFLFLLSSFLLS